MSLFSCKRSSRRDTTKKDRLRKAMQGSMPLLEPMEPRQLMSASTVSAVDFTQTSIVPIHVGGGIFYERVSTPKTAVFSVGSNGNVYETTGSGTNINWGGTVSQISAGLDSSGNPEVFAITANGTPFSNDNGAGWKNLGGWVSQISASIDGTVFGLGRYNNVYENQGSGWSDLGGDAKQISAGVERAVLGTPEVYEIDAATNQVFVNLTFGGGWKNLGGYLKQISGNNADGVYGIGGDNEVYMNNNTNNGGTGWIDLGGQATQVAAGEDGAGQPEVFCTGLPQTQVFSNDNGSGWIPQGLNAIELTAPTVGPAVANTEFAIVGMNGQTYVHNGSTFYSTPTTLDAVQREYQTLGGATSTLGAPTSYTEYYSAGEEGYFQNGKIIDKAGTFTVIPTASSITWSSYTSGHYISTGAPIGGNAVLTVNSNGSYSLSYNFNNGSWFPYDYTVSVSLISPTGTVFVFSHSYDLSGEGNDSGTITGNDPRIAADWQDLQGSQVIPNATAAFSFGGLFEALGKDILTAGDDIVSALGSAYSDDGGTGDTTVDDGGD